MVLYSLGIAVIAFGSLMNRKSLTYYLKENAIIKNKF